MTVLTAVDCHALEMNAEHISSYPSIFTLGHRVIKDIFSSPVVIEEKIDGSQFSMSRTNGVLRCRSKGKEIVVDAPEKMFAKAVETAKSLDLHDGWVYRGEYLQSPKHNTLKYNCVPPGYIIIFDIQTGPEAYLSPIEKRTESHRIGLGCVPVFLGDLPGTVNMTRELAEELLQKDSCLGGCKIEGFVVKNYNLFTAEKKIAIAKFVSEAFKEKHAHEWKVSNPGAGDFVEILIASLKTEARWNKAVQHLREVGSITDSPQDIGMLINEVQADTLKEESDFIRDRLYAHFIGQINRGVIRGLPEWYKARLASFVPEQDSLCAADVCVS